jgi:uncharacterized membrane protein YraQ (UPF0718 family)
VAYCEKENSMNKFTENCGKHWWVAALIFGAAIWYLLKTVGSWTLSAARIIGCLVVALAIGLLCWALGAEIAVAAVIGCLVGAAGAGMAAEQNSHDKSTAVTDMSATNT